MHDPHKQKLKSIEKVNQGSIMIFVKTMAGEGCTVYLDPNDSYEEFKSKIQGVTSFTSDNQWFSCNGQQI